jgi:hypothetical protein
MKKNSANTLVPAIPPGLQCTELDVYCAYFRLTLAQQRVFEAVVLVHLLFPNGMATHTKNTRTAVAPRRDIYLELLRNTSLDMARAWCIWASAMAKYKRPSSFWSAACSNSWAADSPPAHGIVFR